MMYKKYFLLFFAGLFLLSFVNANLYYEVSAEYDKGDLVVSDFDVVYSKLEQGNFYSEDVNIKKYDVKMFNSFGEEVYAESVSIPNVIIGDTFNESVGAKIIYLENLTFDLYFPYLENINKVVISDLDGEVIEEVDVVTFAKVRGDVSSDKDNDGDVGGGSSRIFFYFLLAIVIVLIAVFVIIFYKKKK